MRAETCILPEKEELVGGQDNAVVTIGTRATWENTVQSTACMSGDNIMKRLVLGSELLCSKETLLRAP